MGRSIVVAAVGALAAVALGAGAARAEDAKKPLNGLTIFNMASMPRADSRDTAFNAYLRESGPAPRPPLGGELQADGSVRYDNVTVIVTNPCRGTTVYEPLLLPPTRTGN